MRGMAIIRAVQGPRLCAYVLAALVVIEIVMVGVLAGATGQPMTTLVVGSVLQSVPASPRRGGGPAAAGTGSVRCWSSSLRWRSPFLSAI